MQELDDNALLREYVERDSEEAFGALVRRHINKVYSVALRHTCDPLRAEEITQAVFVTFTRKARRLGKNVVLSGWFYQTARLTAVTLIRSEIRRAHREQEAYMQTSLNESGPGGFHSGDSADAWSQIAPLLDSAMAGLSEADRHAVVLRFFDGHSMSEVGTALGASEDAAKKRVHRAVEKLRAFFARRGIIASAGALTAAISANSVQAAPMQLAASVTASSLAQAAGAAGGLGLVAKGLAYAAAALMIGGVAYFGVRQLARAASAPRFGSVHELFLNDSGNAAFLDLDTAKVLPEYSGTRTAFEDWKKENGVDIALPKLVMRGGTSRYELNGEEIKLPPATVKEGVSCFELKRGRYHNSSWKEMSAAQIIQEIAAHESEEGETNDFVLSGTYVFKTREGAAGIMQINLYSAFPRSVRIRYKLVDRK